jgi:hypothetical protein
MSSSTVDPETLARIAAQLNPQLACDDPAKAIQLARNLLIAADPELAEQAKEARLHEETERAEKLFPLDERISVADAFKALPGPYKTEGGFAAALRKEKLTTWGQDVDFAQWRKAETPDEEEKFVKRSEVTSIRAVNELFRLKREAKQERDRARKTASTKKNQKNVAEFQGQKAEQIRRKAEPKNKKRKRQTKKRKPHTAP